ncbi:MAG TPA: Fur family transcriptional regulator [Acidimicrobiales bacterium]
MAGQHHRHPHDHDVDAELERILSALRDDGGRVTTGRRAVVRALLTADDHHVTAEDIAATVQRDHPDVHLSTVYRTLEALESRGIVGRVNLGTGSAVHHLMDHAHHHLVCDVCGSVTEVDDDAFTELRAEMERRYGFAMSPQHLAVAGRCADCR